MSSRLIDVFFYGLFMDADLLRANGFEPANGRRARVSGMALRIGRRATLVPDPASSVHGFVFGLSHPEIDRLYQEPSVAMYRPEAVIAHLEDQPSVPALCFNLPPSNEAEPANPEYATKLRTVGMRLGLPAGYLATIQ
jgi:hypothetical protein